MPVRRGFGEVFPFERCLSATLWVNQRDAFGGRETDRLEREFASKSKRSRRKRMCRVERCNMHAFTSDQRSPDRRTDKGLLQLVAWNTVETRVYAPHWRETDRNYTSDHEAFSTSPSETRNIPFVQFQKFSDVECNVTASFYVKVFTPRLKHLTRAFGRNNFFRWSEVISRIYWSLMHWFIKYVSFRVIFLKLSSL